MTTKLANGASTHDQITKSRLSNGHQANSFHQKRGWPTIGSDLKVIWEMSVQSMISLMGLNRNCVITWFIACIGIMCYQMI